ncbi:MAG: aldo/keto reductase [Acidobacteriia bacterium]|nr:aldo/keto reductase [Terriglobia bacterium]
MDTRTLPHTDLTVSRACFGTMTFGSQADAPAAARLVDCCLDRGVNFFDTANMYNAGVAETILGEILKGRRDRVVLASKVRFPVKGAPAEAGLSRAAMSTAIDASLRRLQTDYLDLYYLHAPDWEVPIEESLETMDALVRAGKVRYPAISNYAAWQVAEMLWIGERKGYKAPHVSQPMYNLLARGIEQEYVAMCQRFGVAMVVYNPLAGGLLTGKQPRQTPLAGTRFDNNQLYLGRYWHPACFDAVDQLRGIAEKAGRTLVDLSLNWLLHHTATDAIILGASKLEQLEQNLDAFERGPLLADVTAACDGVWSELRGVTPKYNR